MDATDFKADLHIHTTASDGIYHSRDIVKKAKAAGLQAIAITDHDTLHGIEPAMEEADSGTIEVIPGIELSTIWNDQEIHILGYFLNYRLGWLQDILNRIKIERIKRMEKIISRLRDLNYSIDRNDIIVRSENRTMGRPHIAKFLVEKGYVKSVDKAFEELLGQGMPAYVPRKSFNVLEAIKIVHRAGGLAVLAHPGLLKNQSVVYNLIVEGLDGIEVFHPNHEQKVCDYYWKLVKDHGLFATGGSDYHGPGLKQAALGCCAVSLDTFQIFKNKALKKS